MADQVLRRLGPSGDGGYLVPDDLEGIAACFSPGVGAISGFELDCIGLGMRAHLADASVTSSPVTREELDFLPKYIRGVHDSESITLSEWVDSLEPEDSGDLLLQIDIEGDEWGVFLTAPRSVLQRFRIIVVEFHRLERFFDANAFPLLAMTFEKLLETHVCVHIHPNNCRRPETVRGIELAPVSEFTFLRRDRLDAERAAFASQFPHPLDQECTTRFEPSVLPKSMYRSH